MYDTSKAYAIRPPERITRTAAEIWMPDKLWPDTPWHIAEIKIEMLQHKFPTKRKRKSRLTLRQRIERQVRDKPHFFPFLTLHDLHCTWRFLFPPRQKAKNKEVFQDSPWQGEEWLT